MSRAVAAALALVTAGTLLLRTGILDSGYWIDEAITVGIASHELGDIPRLLRLDGSPPLFYLLLHGWMAVAGTGEAATRSLALVFALLAVPVSWWAGSAAFGRRAGALAAVGRGRLPVPDLLRAGGADVLAGGGAVRARVRELRARVRARAAAPPVAARAVVVLLLYAHNWALFLLAGLAAAWLWLWHEGRVDGRDGALLAGGVALLVRAVGPEPRSSRPPTPRRRGPRGPSPLNLIGIPGVLFGYRGAAAAGARRRRRARSRPARPRARGCWR